LREALKNPSQKDSKREKKRRVKERGSHDMGAREFAGPASERGTY